MTDPISLSIICGFVALIGIAASVVAMLGVTTENKTIARAKAQLLSSAAWVGAKVDDQQTLDNWISSQHIDKSSHVASIIRTAWLSWFLGRPANAAEFHANIARRERRRHSARLASGIAATLLIFGIVGTLICVKGVLQDFKLEINLGGVNAGGAAANAKEANDLMSHLAQAFYPSMTALIGTIIVVTSRGFYAAKMHHLVVDLDELTDSLILPRFRVSPLSVQFEHITDKLFNIATKIEQRDANFAQAVDAISEWSGKLSPSLAQFKSATDACTNAANQLNQNAQSLSNSLNKQLGENSSLVTAIDSLSYSYDQAKQLIDKTSESLSQMEEGKRASQEALTTLITETKANLSSIPEEIEKHCKLAGEKSAQTFDEVLKSREQTMKQSAAEAAKSLSTALTPSIEEIKHSANSLAKDATAAKDDSKELLEAAKKNLQELTSSSTKAIQESKASIQDSVQAITSSLNETKAQIGSTTKELSSAAAALPSVNEQLKANSHSLSSSTKQIAKSAEGLQGTADRLIRKLDEKPAPSASRPTDPVHHSAENEDANSVTSEHSTEKTKKKVGFFGRLIGRGKNKKSS